MPGEIETEYQRALFTVLNGAKSVLGVMGVYDTAPTNSDGGSSAVFPYIVMGDIYPIQLDTQTREGFQITSRIHVFSRSGAMLEAKEIQGRMYRLLHRKPMDIMGFSEYSLLRNDTDCRVDQDGKVHGVCDYVGLVEKETSAVLGLGFGAGFSTGFERVA